MVTNTELIKPRILWFKDRNAYLYSPAGECLGEMDYLQFLDVRVRIKQAKASGYYIKWKDKNWKEYIIPIDSDGRIETWHEGFYDFADNMLMELL